MVGGAVLASCGVSGSNDVPAAKRATGPGAVDYAVWRDVAPGKRRMSLAMMCAGHLDGLESADQTLKDRITLQLPWSVQVARHGKLQAQCEWSGPNGRGGRVVVDVLCPNDESERCSRLAYANEGAHRIEAVAILHHPPPPVSSAFPPGRDDVERGRSNELLAWARDHGPDEEGVLRLSFRSTRVGIVDSAKIPFLCGEAKGAGPWHRFAVYSIGAAAFYWVKKPADVRDFCDVKKEDLQWYVVPDNAMNGS
jgi:hypothetical protein